MAGGILQLQALGIQDIYLTKDPQINVFKYTYYKYVNFATEIMEITLDNPVSFGGTSTVTIPFKGHLLSKLYLNMTLPTLTPNGGTYACWTDTIGYGIFDGPIELQVNGQVVDKLYPTCMDIQNELSTNASKQPGLNQMILKSDIYRSTLYNATQETFLNIPLDFWFTKNYSMALPLLSIINQELKISMAFKDFNSVINYDGNVPSVTDVKSSKLYAEYIFLDDVILEQFQSQKHQYIINQTVSNEIEYIESGQNTSISQIYFKNPCKELLFSCVSVDNVYNNNIFNYSRPDNQPFVNQATLLLDNKHRFNDFQSEYVFRHIYPNNVHNVIPNKYIYSMPFSLDCDNYQQPVGSLNMARFDNIQLSLKLNSGNPKCILQVFGVMLNCLTIIDGNMHFEWMNV
jgi:hypothetical protein